MPSRGSNQIEHNPDHNTQRFRYDEGMVWFCDSPTLNCKFTYRWNFQLHCKIKRSKDTKGYKYGWSPDAVQEGH